MIALPRTARRGLPFVLFLGVAAVVLLIISGGLLWNVSVRRKLAADAAGFSMVSGSVVSIDFERLRRGRGPSGVRHRPLVEYTYEVGGRAYRGRTVSPLAPEFLTREDADAWFEDCNVRVGGPVDVFHDPADPSRSVLMKDVGPEFASRMGEWEVGGWVCGGIGLVFGVLAGVGLVRRGGPRGALG